MFTRAKNFLKFLIIVAVSVCVLVFAVANREPVAVKLYPLPYEIETPKFLLAMIFFILGALIGGMVVSLNAIRRVRELKAQKKRVAVLENEVAGMQARAGAHLSIPSPLVGEG